MAQRPRPTPKTEDVRKTAESLRRIVALTSGLPDDSQADARLRDRLEYAGDVLDAASGEEERADRE